MDGDGRPFVAPAGAVVHIPAKRRSGRARSRDLRVVIDSQAVHGRATPPFRDGRTVYPMRDQNVPLRFERAGLVDYLDAWERQRRLVEARTNDAIPDTVLLLEHPAVYTAGKRTQPEDRPTDGTPVVDVDRGGRITWHGPGQLVGYPIIKLAAPVDVVGYVRLLEEVLIASCADLGLVAGRVAGRSGVWLPADSARPERKVAAIGVRTARGVTMHGFALNCDPDLSGFDRIVPCGITDAGVTSLTLELGRRITVSDALGVVTTRLTAGLNGDLPVDRSGGSVRRHSPDPMSAESAPGVDWHLHPVLSGQRPS
jgi:lipoyl(octanoyl) transferase